MRLRSFSCLTKGDVIAIEYNNRIWEIGVVEVKPGNAVSIVETDMNVEFEDPDDYVPVKYHPVKKKEDTTAQSKEVASDVMEHEASGSGFVPFSGAGRRLDGRDFTKEQKALKPLGGGQTGRFAPDYNWKVGQLTFIRDYKRSDTIEQEKQDEGAGFVPFGGSGHTVKDQKKPAGRR